MVKPLPHTLTACGHFHRRRDLNSDVLLLTDTQKQYKDGSGLQ